MDTEARPHRNNLYNQENLGFEVEKKRKSKNQTAKKRKSKNQTELTPEEKALKKKLDCRLRLLRETPEQRELRLEKLRKYKESRTPEQKQASKLKNALYTRRYREEKLNVAKTQEEREALLLQRIEYSRNYREKLKSLAKTPEQKEALRLKLLEEKRRSVEKLKKLPNRDSLGRLNTPGQRQTDKEKTNSEGEDNLLIVLRRKRKRKKGVTSCYQTKQVEQTSGQSIYLIGGENGVEEQTTSDFTFAVDKIKIEKEVLQESTIQTIPARLKINRILEENSCNSSWPWLDPSEENFLPRESFECERNVRQFHGRSSSTTECFRKVSSKFTKVDRRKSGVEEFFSCMRKLINATAKRDELAVFGKHIAHKIRDSKKGKAEFNIAKLLIDNILRNLEMGVYNKVSRNVCM